MRTLILIGFFACLYLHFQKQDAVVEQLDVLSTKQSALKKMDQSKVDLPAITHIQTPTQNNESNDSVQMISEADVGEEYSEDDLSQLPWDDIEEGWKTHLKDYLVSVDPDKAEEMFAAYMEEKKKYVERVDFSDSETGVTEDAAATPSTSSSDPFVEHDSKEGSLEDTHQANLKEIFGDHYSQVESLHKEYVDSVQYLNRSSVKFSISL
jgi:hypothetical protein